MTLEEIAVLAGVSRATVSRVVNNQPSVNAQTRARVQRVIDEHGYRPNMAARALASHHSHTIGLVIPTALSGWLNSSYFTLLFQGAATACEQRSYNMMLSPLAAQTPEAYDRIISGGYVDGLVVTTTAVGIAFLDSLLDEKLPFVLIGRHPARDDLNTVHVENVEGARTAAAHLASLGYKRIAMIVGSEANTTSVDRKAGFLAGLHAAGLACPPEYLVPGDFTEDGGQRAMEILLALPEPPQAVFCSNDLAAIGALRAARAHGLAVPDDIALVGFDDLPVSAVIDPPLTTMRHPIERIGFLATSLLIDHLEAISSNAAAILPPQQILLPADLVVRSSCGAKGREQAPLAA